MTENTASLEFGLDQREGHNDPRWLMTIGGAIGLVAAIVLTIDKLKLSDNPNQTFSCDLNAFVSCAGVMASDESSAFGFPNSILGIIGFAGVLVFGGWLLTGRRLSSIAWAALQVGTVFGIGFVTWLQYQSIYHIQKLCPYCMLVWAVMIPIFVWITARNLRAYAPNNRVSRFVGDWALLISILWYVAVAAAIWFKFGENLWI